MKGILAISAIVLIVGFGAYLLFSGEETIVNYPPRSGPIVAFGDSLVRGVGAPEGGDFVTLLSEKIGEPIINMGVPGDTTADGLARIGEVLKEEPRIVVLLLGGNDYLRRISKEETFQNLRQIVQTFQADGILVVLLGVRGGVLTDGFDSNFKALAEETGSVYIEDVLDNIFGKPALMADGIHPNGEGYTIIANKVYPHLAKVLR